MLHVLACVSKHELLASTQVTISGSGVVRHDQGLEGLMLPLLYVELVTLTKHAAAWLLAVNTRKRKQEPRPVMHQHHGWHDAADLSQLTVFCTWSCLSHTCLRGSQKSCYHSHSCLLLQHLIVYIIVLTLYSSSQGFVCKPTKRCQKQVCPFQRAYMHATSFGSHTIPSPPVCTPSNRNVKNTTMLTPNYTLGSTSPAKILLEGPMPYFGTPVCGVLDPLCFVVCKAWTAELLC